MDIPPVCILKHLIFVPLACCSHKPPHSPGKLFTRFLEARFRDLFSLWLQEMNIGSVLSRKTILHHVPHMASNTVPLLYCVTTSFQTKPRTEQSSSSSSHSQHVQGSWCWTLFFFVVYLSLCWRRQHSALSKRTLGKVKDES